MQANVTLTLSDGSTKVVEVVMMQQRNGDLFISDLLNGGTLDNLSIANVKITEITNADYKGWYSNQSVDNTVIAPVTVSGRDGTVSGTSGDDKINADYVDADGDRIDANDQILSGAGANDDLVYAGDGKDEVKSGAGNDIVYGGAGDDKTEGGTGNDTLFGGAGKDELKGDSGDDTLFGGDADDKLFGGTGNDTLFGGNGNDGYLKGGEGDDVIYGGAGKDKLEGEDGSDALFGGAGDDKLKGGKGNDTLVGGDGADKMEGGDDRDTFTGITIRDKIDGGSAGDNYDTLDLRDAGPTNVVYKGDDKQDGVVQFLNSDGTVKGTAEFKNIENVIMRGDGTVSGTSGDDLIDVNYDGDTDGDFVDNNDAFISGDSGNDDLIVAGAGNDTVLAGDGDDEVYGGSGNDTLSGQDGNDVLFGGAGRDVIEGNAGQDTIYGDSGANATPAVSIRENFEWDQLSEDQIDQGFVVNTGTVTVTYNRDVDTGSHNSSLGSDQLNTTGIDAGTGTVDTDSSLKSVIKGEGHQCAFSWGFSTPVENVSFNVNDIDGDGVVKITAFDAAGNKIPVTLTGGSKVTLLDTDSVAGADTADSNGGYTDDTSAPTYTINVSIAGPVSRVVLEHTQDGSNYSGIAVTDIYYDAAAPEDLGNFDDTIDGGTGDDLIFGQDGNDSILGGAGNDEIYGDNGTNATQNVTLDFNGLSTGVVVNGQYVGQGVTISSLNAANPVMAFDSNNPSGGDTDLGYDTQGQILILSEDGDSTDPDDNASGGTFRIAFDAPTDVQSITLLDIDGGATVIVFDVDGNELGQVDYVTSDNGKVVADLSGISNGNVGSINVVMGGSGAIDDLKYTNAAVVIGGDDVIDGGLGDDVIYGEAGDDTIINGAGADTIYGGDNADTIIGGNDGDFIDGGTGGVDDDGVLADDDRDVLDLRGLGPVRITQTTDADGDSTSGIVEFLDATGTVTGSLEFAEIEKIMTDPIAVADAATVDENNDPAIEIANVLDNDSDPDGDTLVVSQVGGDAAGVGAPVAGDNGGLITINADGSTTFDPNGAFDGLGDGENTITKITYTATDPSGVQVTQTLTVTVTGTNDAPVAVADTGTTDEDTSVTLDNVLGNDTDVDDTVLTVSQVGDVAGNVGTPVAGDAGGLFTISEDGTASFDPNGAFDALAPGDTANTTVTYTITDPDGLTSTTSVTVTVTGVNDGPVAVNNTYAVGANETFGDIDGNLITDDTGTGVDNDPESDTLTVQAVDGVAGNVGTAVAGNNGGLFTIQPDGTVDFDANGDFDDLPLGATAQTSVTYTIVDAAGMTDVATATFVVSGINDGTVQGTAGNDIINPSIPYVDADGDIVDGDDAILAGKVGNDDVIEGFGGDDTINAGDGDDTVFGGTGDDSIMGGVGNDVLMGNDGNDTVSSGAGDDMIFGAAGNDSLAGNAGNDKIEGSEGNDTIRGGDGEDDLWGGLDDDTVFGGDDNDTVSGGAGNDALDGGLGDDTVFGDDGDDSITGGDGDDSIDGGTGNDSLFGGKGNDVVAGGDGNDFINAGNHDNPAADYDYPGNNSAENDQFPDNDRDTVFGGAGDDTITTGDDADSIDGGAGNDFIDAGIDNDSVTGGDGNDTIIGNQGEDIIEGNDGDDLIYGGLADEVLNLPDASDPAPDDNRDTIYGGAGNDTIFGRDDADTLFGGDGNDILDGGVDDDVIFGDAGDDTLIGGQGDDQLIAGTGNDDVFGGTGNDTIDAGDGNDVVAGGAGNDSILGGAGDDRITGGAGVDKINAGFGTDTIYGGNGGDVVVGGEDADNSDIDVLDLTGSNVQSIVYDPGDPESGTVTFLDGTTMTFSEIENVIPCFTPGTTIATAKGERLVEELHVGDRIITRDNGIQEIAWMGHKEMSGRQLVQNPHLKPILIKAGALGNGLPERDMMVSPNHRVLVASELTQLYFEENEVLAAAKHMVGAKGIHAVDVIQTTYVHFMFERHEVVLSNGAWTESFQPGDYSLKGIGNSQRNEIMEIFPELATRTGLDGYQSARKALKKYEAKLLLK